MVKFSISLLKRLYFSSLPADLSGIGINHGHEDNITDHGQDNWVNKGNPPRVTEANSSDDPGDKDREDRGYGQPKIAELNSCAPEQYLYPGKRKDCGHK